MQRFFWRDAEDRPIGDRYPEGPARQAWQGLLDRINPFDPDPRVFDEFRRDAAGLIKRSQTCCVFISHRQRDVNSALHVAWLANQAGYDYWLDVHDPTLRTINGASLPSPAKDILIAAVVEIALLSVTHVIALHTRNSAGSKWIPYELGRAKARLPYSDQAAGWFSRHTSVAACGEYVYLARQTFTAKEITGWLLGPAHQGCQSTANQDWEHGDPPPLDED